MDQICQDAYFIMGPAVIIVKIVRFAVPILLILLVIFDFTKALVGQVDDKAKKDAFGKAFKRLIYAMIVFLVPSVINFVLLKIEPISRDPSNTSKTSTSYLGCWNHYYNK